MTVLKHFRKVGKNRCDQHQKNDRCKHRFIDLQHVEKLIRHKVSDLSGRQVLILPDHKLNKILKMQFFFREQFPDCRIQILYLCQLPDFLLCFLLCFFQIRFCHIIFCPAVFRRGIFPCRKYLYRQYQYEDYKSNHACYAIFLKIMFHFSSLLLSKFADCKKQCF